MREIEIFEEDIGSFRAARVKVEGRDKGSFVIGEIYDGGIFLWDSWKNKKHYEDLSSDEVLDIEKKLKSFQH